MIHFTSKCYWNDKWQKCLWIVAKSRRWFIVVLGDMTIHIVGKIEKCLSCHFSIVSNPILSIITEILVLVLSCHYAYSYFFFHRKKKRCFTFFDCQDMLLRYLMLNDGRATGWRFMPRVATDRHLFPWAQACLPCVSLSQSDRFNLLEVRTTLNQPSVCHPCGRVCMWNT